MKIKSIESFILSDKLSKSFYFSQWEYTERRICIVKVTSDTGHTGWGEGYGPAGLIKAGIEFLTPFIIGQDPLATETIWSIMYRRTVDFARRGIMVSALSAIDVALWDLKGKIMEQPVHLLLGGKKRDVVVPYATGMYFTDCDDLGQALSSEAKEAIDIKLLELDAVLARLKVKTDELRSNIIIAETKSQSWLARNWRPILMLTIIAIIANNYIIFPYASLFTTKVKMLVLPGHLWSLLKIGVGGYIVGRSAEQVVKTIKK